MFRLCHPTSERRAVHSRLPAVRESVLRICFVGKYPPIEGGVSVQSYWTLRGLAERGHEVYVVTNADEVEDHYRLRLEGDDADWLEPRFPSVGGSVRVRNCERFSRRRMNHIPLANPFVTKLASLVTQTVRQHGCQAIYSYYFEPYGVAGHLAAQWTGVPHVVKHAGSDLERLMKVPDLSTAYREIVRAAALVLTRKGLVERFLRMGVGAHKVRAGLGFSPAPWLFNPQAAPLDVNGLLRRLAAQGPAIHDACPNTDPLDLSKPTIGIYGKVGEFKGSFDLVNALGLLKREGLDFNLLAMTHGTQGERFRKALHENSLEDRTRVLPFVPNWRVPSFIRACAAICFLERDSPIAIHGPMIPREVIACGTCLILSGEVASKQPYRDSIRDRENMLVVNPAAREDLAARLRFVIQEPEEARAIGARGRAVSEAFEDYPAFIRNYENLFLELAGGEARPARRNVGTSRPDTCGQNSDDEFSAAADQPRRDVREVVASYFPCTGYLLSDRMETILTHYGQAHGLQNDLELDAATRFGDSLSQLLARRLVTPAASYFDDVFRFERLAASFFVATDEDDRVPPFPAADELGGREVGDEAVGDLRPVQNKHARVYSFDYDISALIAQLRQGTLPPDPYPKRATLMLFHKAPNLARLTLKISEPTNDLLTLCDGTHTTRMLLAKLVELHGVDCEDDKAALKLNAVSMLNKLYGKGIITFCR